MEYNLEGKKFKSVSNTDNGEVGDETVFTYHQDGIHVWAEYSGGVIIKGSLVAIKNSEGKLNMHYHHINNKHEIMVGRCISTPTLTSQGKLMFTEKWQWLNGDCSSGESAIIEV